MMSARVTVGSYEVVDSVAGIMVTGMAGSPAVSRRPSHGIEIKARPEMLA